MKAKTPRRTPEEKWISPGKKQISSGVNGLTQPRSRFWQPHPAGWHGNAGPPLRNRADGWGKPDPAAARRIPAAARGTIAWFRPKPAGFGRWPAPAGATAGAHSSAPARVPRCAWTPAGPAQRAGDEAVPRLVARELRAPVGHSTFGPKQFPNASVITPSGCTVTGTMYSSTVMASSKSRSPSENC